MPLPGGFSNVVPTTVSRWWKITDTASDVHSIASADTKSTTSSAVSLFQKDSVGRHMRRTKVRHSWTLNLASDDVVNIEVLHSRLTGHKRVVVDGEEVFNTRKTHWDWSYQHISGARVTLRSAGHGFQLQCDEPESEADAEDVAGLDSAAEELERILDSIDEDAQDTNAIKQKGLAEESIGLYGNVEAALTATKSVDNISLVSPQPSPRQIEDSMQSVQAPVPGSLDDPKLLSMQLEDSMQSLQAPVPGSLDDPKLLSMQKACLVAELAARDALLASLRKRVGQVTSDTPTALVVPEMDLRPQTPKRCVHVPVEVVNKQRPASLPPMLQSPPMVKTPTHMPVYMKSSWGFNRSACTLAPELSWWPQRTPQLQRRSQQWSIHPQSIQGQPRTGWLPPIGHRVSSSSLPFLATHLPWQGPLSAR